MGEVQYHQRHDVPRLRQADPGRRMENRDELTGSHRQDRSQRLAPTFLPRDIAAVRSVDGAAGIAGNISASRDLHLGEAGQLGSRAAAYGLARADAAVERRGLQVKMGMPGQP